MAWEWVAPFATLLAGVAGMYFTWRSGKEGREHVAALAKEERQQRRLEETYVALLDMAEQAGAWAQAVRPRVNTAPPQEVPPLPSLAEQTHVEARVNAFGSGQVRRLMHEWREIVQSMARNSDLIELERHDEERDREGSTFDWDAPQKRIDALRPREREAREGLSQQIATELGHR